MPRLPLGDLEEARRDPGAYRRKLDAAEQKRFGNTYIGALRNAIYRYHRTQDADDAGRYLEDRLAAFGSARRNAETLDQLDWYIDDITRRGWPAFQTGLRVAVPLPPEISPDLTCTGQVDRVDVVPSGGYAAWLFRSKAGTGWADELRMPILQHVLANQILNVPLDEIRVGIYAFQDQWADSRCYSEAEAEAAYGGFENLLARLGFC